MASQDRKLQSRTYEQQLILEASLQNRTYGYNKLQPSVFFWKELTANPTQTPLCFVPDTLVLNEKDMELMWIYTSPEGRICRETNINFKDFVGKITSYSSPNQLVAILKRPIFSERLGYSNDFKLLNSRFLLNCSQQQMGQKEQVVCLQRFIKSNGSKPFLCRTIFSKEKSSECFLITNSRHFYDNQPENKKFVVRPGDKSTIVKSKQGKNLEETVKYLKEIVQYLKFFRGIDITQLAGDFIKDEMGNWWLVNIKAFKANQKIKKGPKSKNIIIASSSSNAELEKQRYQKTKLCRYCQKSYLESELTFKMTMRMIIEIDKYLLHMGKQYNWLKRSDIPNVDTHCLYQQHKVCTRCFRLYSEIQELMQVQRKFLLKQGQHLIAHPKQLIFSQTNEQHLRLQAKQKQIHRLKQQKMPEMIELGPNTNITIKDQRPIKNDQIINKMLRLRLLVFLNEIDQVTDVNPNLNYFLQFTLFNKKSKYRLNMGLAQQKIIPLNKLKVFYFFANSIESLQQEYMATNPSFKMFITTQHKQSSQKRTIGTLQFPFKDFLVPINHKKDFYKFFHVEKVSYGWGLQGSIGIIPSEGEVTTAKIAFQKSQGEIYIPNENYYFCEALTQQWIDLIKTKSQRTAHNRAKLKSMRSPPKDRHSECRLTGQSRVSSNLMLSKAQKGSTHPLSQININQEDQNQSGSQVIQKSCSQLDFLGKQIANYQKTAVSRSSKCRKVSRNRPINMI